MAHQTGKDIITGLFRDVLQSPSLDMSAVEKYIDPSYTQSVDGVALNYDGFLAHMRKLKSTIASLSVEFLAMAEDSDTVFTNHVVTAKKNDGSQIRVKVIAQFVVHGNRLISCDELTRLLSGAPEDRDMGSRH
ncbi:MAG: nuclear transport factor 2 family protein [Nitrosomonadales bacterium]